MKVSGDLVDWARSKARLLWQAVAPHAGPDVVVGAVADILRSRRELILENARREVLDHVLLLGEQKLEDVAWKYAIYFNKSRPHRGIGQRIPVAPANDNHDGEIVAVPVLGGLHHDYRRAA